MILRAAQGWRGQRSIASTPVDRPWGGPGFGERAVSAGGVDQALDRAAARPISSARSNLLLVARHYLIRGARPWRPSTHRTSPHESPSRPPGLSFRYLRANATLARMPWRSHRVRDRWSRGTIPYPPTPHHNRAKADNDCDQDRQDGDSCIILKLPVTEWVSCCTTGFERHPPDRKLSRLPSVIQERGRGGTQGITPGDDPSRSTVFALAGWANDLEVAGCGAMWGDVTGGIA